MSEFTNEDFADMRTLVLNKERRSIINCFGKERRGVTDIAEALGLDRSIVCYHFDKLESRALIGRGYEILEEPKEDKPGKAQQVFYLTPKVQQTINNLGRFIDYLETTVNNANIKN